MLSFSASMCRKIYWSSSSWEGEIQVLNLWHMNTKTLDESLMPSRLLLWVSLAGGYRNNITVAALLQLSCYLGCYNEPSCGRPYYKRTADQIAFSASITSTCPILNKCVNFVLHKLLKCKKKCARITSSWLLLLRHWGVASALTVFFLGQVSATLTSV